MKLRSLLLSFLLLFSAASFAYDMESHVPGHIISQANWDTMVQQVQAKGSDVVRFGSLAGTTWTFNAINLQLPSNITIQGDGQYITTFRLGSGVSTSASDNWFISIGQSRITFQNFRILTNSKRLNAVFKFNSMGGSSSTECTNITINRVFIDSSYANGIKGGETTGLQNGQSHHITDLNVLNCEIAYLGNPAALYTTADGAAQSSICHGIAFNQTTWGGTVFQNYIHDCSGDGINCNLSGWNNSYGMVLNTAIGKFFISQNRIYNTYSNIVFYGNWGYGLLITENELKNPTGNGEFNWSIEGINIVTDGNRGETYQGRNATEEYGAGCSFGKDVFTLYLGEHPIVATRRSDSRATTQFSLTGGFENTYYQTYRYDTTLGISSNIPGRRAGIHISNKSQPGYQPATWDGRNYAFGFDIHSKLYNCTGPALYAEIIPISDVVWNYDALAQSSFINEDVIRIGGKRWKIFGQIDGSGSTSTSAGAVSVNTTIAGTANTAGLVQPLITNWNNATKLKNTNLYTYRSYVTLPQASFTSN